MAVKGTIAKSEITESLLRLFKGSFLNGKEIRIPWQENGEVVEIKVSLVCAKDILGAAPDVEESTPVTTTPTVAEPSTEEKQAVSDLLSRLGL